MKILMMSKEGDGMGVAHRLVREGHDVALWIQEPRFNLAGKGIVRRPREWRPEIPYSDLIICDMVGFGNYEGLFKRFGKPVLSCSPIFEMAEYDRGKGMQLFKALGIEIPETYSCKNPEEAKGIISGLEWGKGFVIKPDGNISTAKTMVVTEQDDFEWSLSTIPKDSLIIQRIVDGVEVSTEGWFNGRNFLTPFNHTFEEKKFLVGNLGPATGCMGNVVLATQSNRLTKATVEKMAPFLAKVGYRGPVDINCIVNANGAYALEVTARMGYDAIETLLGGLQEPVGDFFFEVAMGVKKEMDLTPQTMFGVRLSVPPWPIAKPTAEHRGEPVGGITEENARNIFLTDVYFDKEDKKFKTAGGDGVLLKVVTTGDPEPEKGGYTRLAARKAYQILKQINISNKQYRTDIGVRVDGSMAKLKEWGWV